ncbi:E3 ubiquitin-protein ligase KEG [Colossoma macropomum]|uniref:E3 ubiquitin-protein ligase KEG n=1 Tax=Colossoma macropomum TaxID=42526 RepID=UPI001863E423|nr:E3 ubiquitin-protein ligase KEG [Colossoma macropomum]
MVLCEDLECGVCYQSYSRSERVPRMLFCNHTFCTACLETMAVERSSMLSVRCPLCRQVSCVRRGHGLQDALWVNSRLWDCIAEDPEQEQEEEGQEEEKRSSATAQAVPPAQSECGLRPSSKQYRPKLRLPSFLKRLSIPRQPQERIVPGCNVQMKSWRRLSGEETF